MNYFSNIILISVYYLKKVLLRKIVLNGLAFFIKFVPLKFTFIQGNNHVLFTEYASQDLWWILSVVNYQALSLMLINFYLEHIICICCKHDVLEWIPCQTLKYYVFICILITKITQFIDFFINDLINEQIVYSQNSKLKIISLFERSTPP